MAETGAGDAVAKLGYEFVLFEGEDREGFAGCCDVDEGASDGDGDGG